MHTTSQRRDNQCNQPFRLSKSSSSSFPLPLASNIKDSDLHKGGLRDQDNRSEQKPFVVICFIQKSRLFLTTKCISLWARIPYSYHYLGFPRFSFPDFSINIEYIDLFLGRETILCVVQLYMPLLGSSERGGCQWWVTPRLVTHWNELKAAIHDPYASLFPSILGITCRQSISYFP